MRTRNLHFALAIQLICTCGGDVTEIKPRSTVRHHETFRGKPISRTMENDRLPPWVYHNAHSSIHEVFQEGRRHSLMDAITSIDADSSVTYKELPSSGKDEELGEQLQERYPEVLWHVLHPQMLSGDAKEPRMGPEALHQILESIGRLYLPSNKSGLVDNTQCIKDVQTIYELKKPQLGNITLLIDSWGKLPDGMFIGNIAVLGFFDECIRVKINVESPNMEQSAEYFKGKYCYVSYKNPDDEGPQEWFNMAPIFASTSVDVSLYRYGTCMPSSCTETDLNISLSNVLAPVGLEVDIVACQSEDSMAVDYNAGLIAMIVIIALLGTLLLCGAIIDVWIQFSGKVELRKGPLKYLLAFSFYTNLDKMFRINMAESKEVITCIYGMRVLSMTWVMWGHQNGLSSTSSVNYFLIPEMYNGHWLTQVILNAYLSVDTFFFMSGLLVSYGIFKTQQDSSGFNVPLYYIHRFIRLSIPILLLSGFLATFPKLLVHGPNSFKLDGQYSIMDGCRKHWWRDALFITNFSIDENEHPQTCIDVCWYTAVDFQLYIATPIILLPFIWRKLFSNCNLQPVKVGVIWLVFLTVAAILIPGIITGVKKLPPAGFQQLDYNQRKDIYYLIYTMPWCRASPYLVGVWLGYVLRLDAEKKIKLRMWQVALGWTVATVTGIAVVFGMYNYTQFFDNPEYNWGASIFYAALHRFAWGMALAWVVFACQYGYAGPVNTFLSHPSWQPLSRLTYCTFLIAHPVQRMIFKFGIMYPLYYSPLNKIFETVGSLFICGLGGMTLSLFTEAPVLGLEKLLLKKGN